MKRSYGSMPLLQASKGRQKEQPYRPQRMAAFISIFAAAAVAALLLVSFAPKGISQGGSDSSSSDGSRSAKAATGSGLNLDSRSSASSRKGGGSGGDASSSSSGGGLTGLESYFPDATGIASKAGADASALAGLESLAAAHKRAQKAAALPKPELRSSADALVLSEGAAAVAAACRGDGCEMVSRFLLAVESVKRLVESGGYAVQHCPDALGIGLRPLPYTSHAFGNRCEPLYTRGALELVRQLVGPEMRGLEWFTGSSTAWYLARLAHLTSIEAAKGFAAKARKVAEAQFEASWLRQRWDLRLVPPRREVITFEDTEDAEVWADYCSVDFVKEGTRFDIISLQGFARMACLRRAVALLRPQGGLLVLPQAQRPAYRDVASIVPAQWVRLTDSHSLGQTLVWVSVNSA